MGLAAWLDVVILYVDVNMCTRIPKILKQHRCRGLKAPAGSGPAPVLVGVPSQPVSPVS